MNRQGCSRDAAMAAAMSRREPLVEPSSVAPYLDSLLAPASAWLCARVQRGRISPRPRRLSGRCSLQSRSPTSIRPLPVDLQNIPVFAAVIMFDAKDNAAVINAKGMAAG